MNHFLEVLIYACMIPPYESIDYYYLYISLRLVFDLTRSTSLKSLEHWRKEFMKHMDIDEYSFICVGNKVDSVNERQITKHQAEKWCEENGGVLYIETSAKTAENVDKLFQEAANEIIKRNKDVK